MTDRRERAVLQGIYDCLNEMTGLAPKNPANIAVIAGANRKMTEAARSLMYAVFGVIAGDLTEARIYLDDARRELEK